MGLTKLPSTVLYNKQYDTVSERQGYCFSCCVYHQFIYAPVMRDIILFLASDLVRTCPLLVGYVRRGT